MKNPHPPGCFWHQAAEVFGAPEVKYCEETLCQFISEPWNTWSNLPIIFVGLAAMFFAKRSAYPWFRALSLSVATVGLLSAIYHLSNNLLTQILDYFSMYLVIGLVGTLGVHRRGWISKKRVWAWYVGGFFLVCALLLAMFGLRIPFQWTNVLLVAVIVNEVVVSRQTGLPLTPLYLACLCFALSISSQVLAVNKTLCSADFGFIEMHVFWHLFNAIGLGFYLKFCFNIKEEQYLKAGSGS